MGHLDTSLVSFHISYILDGEPRINLHSNNQMREGGDLRVSVIILFALQWKNHFFTSPMCRAIFGMAGSEIR
jgi:hypothetical protein